jgi:adenylate cyclase
MSGFTLRDSANFDDWQLFEAQRLRRELDGALLKLVRGHIVERQFETAEGFARRRLALDPLDESAHCQLMRLHAWSGHRSAALRQYEECVDILQDQLGVPPQQETTDLYETIREDHAPPLPDDERTQLPPKPSAEPPAFLQQDTPIEPPIFVAREAELARLERYLQEALRGQAQVVFVTGDAGCGKTALIQEFARRAQESYPDLIIATGHSNAHTGIGDPYLPFREILGLLTGDVEAQWSAGAMTTEQARRLWQLTPLTIRALVKTGWDLIELLVPGTPLLERAAAFRPWPIDKVWLAQLEALVARKSSVTGMSALQQAALFEQYAQVLWAVGREKPLLLALDDLQWADAGSLHLLFHLGRRMAGCPLLLVGAYRPAEVALGRPAYPHSMQAAPLETREVASTAWDRHPLEAIVNEFRRSFGRVEVNVERAEDRPFVDAFLDSEPNRLGDAFREALHQHTLGNPLFTHELLHGMQERGDLIQDGEGKWIEGPELDWDTMPVRVEAVVAERIGRLSPSSRQLLSAGSVEGETFTAELVARVQGSGERDTVRCLSETLDRQHRLVSAKGIRRLGNQLLSQYRFRHILFQKYLYSSLDPVERVYLHERVGTALEELHQDRDTASVSVQLARHFEEAGIPEKAIHYLHQAGERAIRLSAYQEALAHLDKGLSLLGTHPDVPESGQKELALQLALGVACVGVKGYDLRAKEIYSRAHKLGQQLGETSQICRAVGEQACLHYVIAEHERAYELAEEALDLAHEAGDPLLVAVSQWFLGFILFALGEFSAARDHLQQMIAFYDPREHHEAFVMLRSSDSGVSALAYDACCLWCTGFPDQALKRSQEALDLARELDHAFSLADVLSYGCCLLHKLRRDDDSFIASASDLRELVNRTLPGWMGSATWHWGEALVLQGHLERGIAEIRKGLEQREFGNEQCNRTGTLCSLAEAQAAAGRSGDGLRTLDEALALVETTGERYYEAELNRLKGELLLMQYKVDEAESNFHKAIEVARHQGAKSWELRATTSLARLWRHQSKTDEARQTLAEIYCWFTEGFDTQDLKEAKALLDELA